MGKSSIGMQGVRLCLFWLLVSVLNSSVRAASPVLFVSYYTAPARSDFITAHTPVLFDLSGSSDADGDSLFFKLDYGDGVTESNTSAPLHEHTFDQAGVYTVRVTASDSASGIVENPAVTAAGTAAPLALLSITVSPGSDCYAWSISVVEPIVLTSTKQENSVLPVADASTALVLYPQHARIAADSILGSDREFLYTVYVQITDGSNHPNARSLLSRQFAELGEHPQLSVANASMTIEQQATLQQTNGVTTWVAVLRAVGTTDSNLLQIKSQGTQALSCSVTSSMVPVTIVSHSNMLLAAVNTSVTPVPSATAINDHEYRPSFIRYSMDSCSPSMGIMVLGRDCYNHSSSPGSACSRTDAGGLGAMMIITFDSFGPASFLVDISAAVCNSIDAVVAGGTSSVQACRRALFVTDVKVSGGTLLLLSSQGIFSSPLFAANLSSSVGSDQPPLRMTHHETGYAPVDSGSWITGADATQGSNFTTARQYAMSEVQFMHSGVVCGSSRALGTEYVLHRFDYSNSQRAVVLKWVGQAAQDWTTATLPSLSEVSADNDIHSDQWSTPSVLGILHHAPTNHTVALVRLTPVSAAASSQRTVHIRSAIWNGLRWTLGFVFPPSFLVSDIHVRGGALRIAPMGLLLAFGNELWYSADGGRSFVQHAALPAGQMAVQLYITTKNLAMALISQTGKVYVTRNLAFGVVQTQAHVWGESWQLFDSSVTPTAVAPSLCAQLKTVIFDTAGQLFVLSLARPFNGSISHINSNSNNNNLSRVCSDLVSPVENVVRRGYTDSATVSVGGAASSVLQRWHVPLAFLLSSQNTQMLLDGLSSDSSTNGNVFGGTGSLATDPLLMPLVPVQREPQQLTLVLATQTAILAEAAIAAGPEQIVGALLIMQGANDTSIPIGTVEAVNQFSTLHQRQMGWTVLSTNAEASGNTLTAALDLQNMTAFDFDLLQIDVSLDVFGSVDAALIALECPTDRCPARRSTLRVERQRGSTGGLPSMLGVSEVVLLQLTASVGVTTLSEWLASDMGMSVLVGTGSIVLTGYINSSHAEGVVFMPISMVDSSGVGVGHITAVASSWSLVDLRASRGAASVGTQQLQVSPASPGDFTVGLLADATVSNAATLSFSAADIGKVLALNTSSTGSTDAPVWGYVSMVLNATHATVASAGTHNAASLSGIYQSAAWVLYASAPVVLYLQAISDRTVPSVPRGWRVQAATCPYAFVSDNSAVPVASKYLDISEVLSLVSAISFGEVTGPVTSNRPNIRVFVSDSSLITASSFRISGVEQPTATDIWRLIASNASTYALDPLVVSSLKLVSATDSIYIMNMAQRLVVNGPQVVDVLLTPSVSALSCEQSVQQHHVVMGCPPTKRIVITYGFSFADFLTGDGANWHKLPVNYRPPSSQGKAVPTTSHVYHADPSQQLRHDFFPVSQNAQFKQCAGKSDRAACRCTDMQRFSEFIADSDCIDRVQSVAFTSLFIPRFSENVVGRETKSVTLSLRLTELNGRVDYCLNTSTCDKDATTLATTPLNPTDHDAIIWLGDELYHFRVEAINGSHCELVTEFKVWVTAAPLNVIVENSVIAITAVCINVALLAIYLHHVSENGIRVRS